VNILKMVAARIKNIVVPAQAGTQWLFRVGTRTSLTTLGSRLRGNDADRAELVIYFGNPP